MKLLTYPAVTALGLTQIYLLGQIGQLLSPNHISLYHWSGTAAGLLLPTVLLYCLLWLTLTLFLLLTRRPGWLAAAIWAVLLAPAPLLLARTWSQISGDDLPIWISAVICVLTVAAIIAIAASSNRNFLQNFERVRRVAGTVLGFVAIMALFTFGQLLWVGWEARDLNAALPLHQPHDPPAANPRIVWILFDELSYQQVYEQRYPGLQLPAFDQLAQQSTVFTNTIPAGIATERVIPSLFTGQPVDAIRSSSNGRRLSLHDPGSHAWLPFDPRQTAFQDALDAGYSTAIAGWYNPYCRIMPQVLDQCFWTFNSPSLGSMSPHRNVAENALASIVHKARFFPDAISRLLNTPSFDAQESRLHQLDYMLISSAADRLLLDPSATFIFLHLPIPHPTGIYNRKTGQFATHSTYIDNLALADQYLAHARTVLEQNGAWDSSTIIVMGDHSWRTYMWKTHADWTPAEQLASHGGEFDPRPAYIVKLPYQHQPALIDFPYDAVHTRALLDALIAEQLHSPSDLSAWAAQRREDSGPKALASTH